MQQGGNAKSTPKKLVFLSLRENSQMWFASNWQRDFCGLYVSPCVFSSDKGVLQSHSPGAVWAAQGLKDHLIPAPHPRESSPGSILGCLTPTSVSVRAEISENPWIPAGGCIRNVLACSPAAGCATGLRGLSGGGFVQLLSCFGEAICTQRCRFGFHVIRTLQ